jgi:hypothetical protein
MTTLLPMTEPMCAPGGSSGRDPSPSSAPPSHTPAPGAPAASKKLTPVVYGVSKKCQAFHHQTCRPSPRDLSGERVAEGRVRGCATGHPSSKLRVPLTGNCSTPLIRLRHLLSPQKARGEKGNTADTPGDSSPRGRRSRASARQTMIPQFLSLSRGAPRSLARDDKQLLVIFSVAAPRGPWLRIAFAMLLFGLAAGSVDAARAVIAATPQGVVVATAGSIRLEGGWSVEGVRNPTAIETSGNRVVVLDAIDDQAVVVDLDTGRMSRFTTASTPSAAQFAGNDLYILARDASLVQRSGGGNIAVAADPAFGGVSGSRLFVYSRTGGVLQEISGDRIVRQMQVAPFASDLEIDGTTAYLAYPRESRIRMIDLSTMQSAGELAVGAVPVDIAFAGGGSAITARVLAVADPSAKRIWMVEGRQSLGKAVARGFVRGLLGLGLFNRSSQFPTGVDRVIVRGSQWVAYDSSSGTLYRFSSRGSSAIATDVGPAAFSVTEEQIVWWDGERIHRLN